MMPEMIIVFRGKLARVHDANGTLQAHLIRRDGTSTTCLNWTSLFPEGTMLEISVGTIDGPTEHGEPDADSDTGLPAGPRLEDRAGLARSLKTSLATVDRLRTQGLPTVWLCDAPRFDVAEVVAWLKERTSRGTT